MNWKIWLQGLGAAALGGAATATTQVITTTGHVQGTAIGISAGVGALLATLTYFMRSPLQPAAAVPPPQTAGSVAPSTTSPQVSGPGALSF